MCMHLKCKNTTYAHKVLSVHVKKLLMQVIMANVLKGRYRWFAHVLHIPVYEATKQPIRRMIEILLQNLYC